MRFLTNGAAALAASREYESQTLEIGCKFSYQGHDPDSKIAGTIVVALTEDFESIEDSIIQQFQHLSTSPRHVSLRVLWYGKRYIGLRQHNINSRLRKMKHPERGKGRELPHEIHAELRDAVEGAAGKVKTFVIGEDYANAQQEHGTKHSGADKAERWAGFASRPELVPLEFGYPGWEGLIPKRSAYPQTQDSGHNSAVETRQSKRQRNAALFNKEGDVIGSKAPGLDPNNKGRRMMENMGWIQGTGLGAANKQGKLQPIAQVFRTSKAGLGASRGPNRVRHDPKLPPGDDTKVNEEIRRTEAKMREKMGDGSDSEGGVPITVNKEDDEWFGVVAARR